MDLHPSAPSKKRGRPKKKGKATSVTGEDVDRVKRSYVKRKTIPASAPTQDDDEDTITFEDAPRKTYIKNVTTINRKKKIGTNRCVDKEWTKNQEKRERVKRAYVKKQHVKAPVSINDDDDDTIKNEDVDLKHVSVKLELTDEFDFSSIGARLDIAPQLDCVAVKSEIGLVPDGSEGGSRVMSAVKRKYTKRTDSERKGKKSEWICKICNKHLVTKAGMAVHMQNHYVEQLQNPARSAELPKPLTENNVVENPIRETLTELFSFNGEGDLSNLVKREEADRDVELKTYQCPVCGKRLSSSCALINHTRLHTGAAGTQEFKCDECGKTFRTKGNMRTHSLIHQRGEGGSERKYACPICDKRYKNGSSLYSHSLLAHGAKTMLKRHGCVACDEAFRYKSELEAHLDKCHPEVARPFKCRLCEEAFTTEVKLQGHLRGVHREGSTGDGGTIGLFETADTLPHLDLSSLSSLLSFDGTTTAGTGQVKEEVNNKYRCHLCHKYLMSPKGLRIHLLTHTDSGKKEFACKDCNKRFRTKYILKAHSLIHTRKYAGERQYACLMCNKRYKNRSSLYSHSLLEHAEVLMMKRHRCLICSQTFRSKAALETHADTRHPGEKPYSCSKCTATFAKDSILRGHLKEVHMELCSLLLCNTCGKQFKRAGQLRDHERVHTGEKPFVCTHCGFKYHFSWELKLHEKRHAIGDADKLVCQSCGATFSTQWSHDMHVRHAHSAGTAQRLRRTGERPLRWRWYDCAKCGERIGRSKEYCAHMGKHRAEELRAARENRVSVPKKRVRSEAQKIVERERNKLYRERKRAKRLGLPRPPSPEEGTESRNRRRGVNGGGAPPGKVRIRNRKRAVGNGDTRGGDCDTKNRANVQLKEENDDPGYNSEMINNYTTMLTDGRNEASYNRTSSAGYSVAARSSVPTTGGHYDERRAWSVSNTRSVNNGHSTTLVHSAEHLPVQWQTWMNIPTHIMNNICSQMTDSNPVGAGGAVNRKYSRNEQPMNSRNDTRAGVCNVKSTVRLKTSRKVRRLSARRMLRKYARLRGDSARSRRVIDAVIGPYRILRYSYRYVH